MPSPVTLPDSLISAKQKLVTHRDTLAGIDTCIYLRQQLSRTCSARNSCCASASPARFLVIRSVAFSSDTSRFFEICKAKVGDTQGHLFVLIHASIYRQQLNRTCSARFSIDGGVCLCVSASLGFEFSVLPTSPRAFSAIRTIVRRPRLAALSLEQFENSHPRSVVEMFNASASCLFASSCCAVQQAVSHGEQGEAHG